MSYLISQFTIISWSSIWWECSERCCLNCLIPHLLSSKIYHFINLPSTISSLLPSLLPSYHLSPIVLPFWEDIHISPAPPHLISISHGLSRICHHWLVGWSYHLIYNLTIYHLTISSLVGWLVDLIISSTILPSTILPSHHWLVGWLILSHLPSYHLPSYHLIIGWLVGWSYLIYHLTI